MHSVAHYRRAPDPAPAPAPAPATAVSSTSASHPSAPYESSSSLPAPLWPSPSPSPSSSSPVVVRRPRASRTNASCCKAHPTHHYSEQAVTCRATTTTLRTSCCCRRACASSALEYAPSGGTPTAANQSRLYCEKRRCKMRRVTSPLPRSRSTSWTTRPREPRRVCSHARCRHPYQANIQTRVSKTVHLATSAHGVARNGHKVWRRHTTATG